MSTEILILTQWFSPAYPIGAFAYSHGLEAANIDGIDDLECWLTDVLHYGAGRSDALFLAASYHVTDVSEIDAQCRAFAPSAERLRETDLQGAAFGKVTSDVWTQVEIENLAYPVAVGRAAKLIELPLKLTTTMFLHAFAANLVAAGQRLAGIGQTEAQALIKRLVPICITIADDSADGNLDQLSSTAFMADIASMKHETQYARIFRT
ncbi:urease accessory protein UreF [Cognatiyoonia koreensis]|nr:urease accessory UreF family protein [Cognatiyoonia koreensis]